MRYGFEGEPIILEEIGNRLNLSRERIRQIEKKAKNNFERRWMMHLSSGGNGDSEPSYKRTNPRYERAREIRNALIEYLKKAHGAGTEKQMEKEILSEAFYGNPEIRDIIDNEVFKNFAEDLYPDKVHNALIQVFPDLAEKYGLEETIKSQVPRLNLSRYQAL